MKQQTTVENSGKKPVSKTRKVLGIIANVLMWLFVAFAVVATIFAFSAQSSSDGIPTIAGKVMSPVISPSMEPAIKKGDLIFTRKLADEEKATLTEGQIISFKHDLNNDGTPEINTHRIIEVITVNGSVYYRTKGDNNPGADPYTVLSTDVISVFEEGKSAKLPVLGSISDFLMKPTGFLVVIVIPLVLFFILELDLFIRKLLQVKNAGKKQITAEDEELIKQRAIEEYLRSQQQAAEKPEEKPEERTAEETPEAPAEEAENPSENSEQ